jgi:hypothetical protein
VFVRTALVRLALGDDAVAATAIRVIAAADRWPDVLQLAVLWRVLPQVYDALGRCGAVDGFDAELRKRLRGQLFAQALNSASVLRTCARVQDLLAQAGVVSVAIKGIATIATIYGSASRRMVADVDLVIEADRLVPARTALEAAGFADVSPPFESHVAAIGVSRYLHNYARTFVRDGIEIDLHWQFGPRPPAALGARRIVERSVEANVERANVRVSGPVETALIAAHHALRNSFPAASTAKDAADLAMWWQRFGDVEGEALIVAALESRLASSLLALGRVIAQRNSSAAIARGVAAMETLLPRAERREAERLRAFVEHNLHGESPDDATLELLAPAVFTRSIVGPLLRSARRGRSAPEDDDGRPPGVRRALLVRIRGRLEQAGRIGRELLRFERVASYRAVARAQSRFH